MVLLRQGLQGVYPVFEESFQFVGSQRCPIEPFVMTGIQKVPHAIPEALWARSTLPGSALSVRAVATTPPTSLRRSRRFPPGATCEPMCRAHPSDVRGTSHDGGIGASPVDPLVAAGVHGVPEAKGDTVSPLSNEAAVRDEP